LTGAELLASGRRRFDGVSLAGAALANASLPGLVVIRSDLSGAVFASADLRGAVLNGSNLTNADFRGAQLAGASLVGIDARGARFDGADLTGANLTASGLTAAQLANATTTRAILPHSEDWEDGAGIPTPLGSSYHAATDVYRFALYGENTTAVTLLLFGADPTHPLLRVPLDVYADRSDRVWHTEIPAEKLANAHTYGYQVQGNGRRYDPEKVLLDPYAKGLYFPPGFNPRISEGRGSNASSAVLGVLPPRRALSPLATKPVDHTRDSVIYEMHVRGFTKSASSGVDPSRAGTYLGAIEKIPHLVALGVTVVELLPIFQYVPEPGGNYWGYMPLNMFCPHQGYATQADAATAESEFRQLVAALHEAGIEVVIDVVYNHTAELGPDGPTFSYRGIDDEVYYYQDTEGQYIDYSGTGNGFRTGHPAVRRLVLDSLRHWVRYYGVDGFRFDLAGILARDSNGVLLRDAPTLDAITTDPDLRMSRFVAEPYDIQTGAFRFPGTSWQQWNNTYRDDVRHFVRADSADLGTVPNLMTRMYGSSDVFPDGLPHSAHAFQSVNFVDSHDGFCLWDVVSYAQSHNEANVTLGAPNPGGVADNVSANYGYEGTEGAPDSVLTFRRRQAKNFMAILMLSQGTPMFCAGDEFLRTQRGNNNPYNQDNETSWIDWNLATQNADMVRFLQHLIAFRKSTGFLGGRRFWRDAVTWHGVGPEADLGPTSRTIAFHLDATKYGGPCNDRDLYVMINAYHQPLIFEIAAGAPGEWSRILDTSLPSPNDILGPGHSAPVDGLSYTVAPHSVVALTRLTTHPTG